MDRIDVLRARIALYRGYLREGVGSEDAARYLKELTKDEAELALLTRDKAAARDEAAED